MPKHLDSLAQFPQSRFSVRIQFSSTVCKGCISTSNSHPEYAMQANMAYFPTSYRAADDFDIPVFCFNMIRYSASILWIVCFDLCYSTTCQGPNKSSFNTNSIYPRNTKPPLEKVDTFFFHHENLPVCYRFLGAGFLCGRPGWISRGGSF